MTLSKISVASSQRPNNNVFRQVKEKKQFKVLHASPMSLLNKDESIDFQKTAISRQQSEQSMKKISSHWNIDKSLNNNNNNY